MFASLFLHLSALPLTTECTCHLQPPARLLSRSWPSVSSFLRRTCALIAPSLFPIMFPIASRAVPALPPNPVLGPHPLPLFVSLLTATFPSLSLAISESAPLLLLAMALLHLPVAGSLSLSRDELQVPRWIDPCKARPFTSIEPIRDFAGVPMTEEQEQEVFDAVIAATRMAYTHGVRVKTKFVSASAAGSARQTARVPAAAATAAIASGTCCGGE